MGANDMDENITQQAESWETEHHKTERERIRLKHARRVAVGRFFKWVFVVGLLCAGGIFGVHAIAQCNARIDAEDQAELERARRLGNFYEKQWVECIQTLGLERCKIIQETGLHECNKWCSRRRFDERQLWLDEHQEE